MKVTLGFWLALTLAASADISDGTDTNLAPVAQPVGSDTTPATTAPKAQPVDVSDPVENANTGAPGADAGPALTVVSASAAKFQYATQAYNAGRYGDAVRSFTEFIQLFPGDRRAEEASFHLAESYRELGRSKDALAAYTYQVGRFPEGPFRTNAELQRGAILFDQGKLADVVAPLQYVLDHGEGVLKEDAQYLLGRAFLATDKEPAGRALLQGLVDVQPPSKLGGNSAQALAELDDTQGKSADAMTLWQKAITLLPTKTAQATAATRGGWSAIAAKQPETAQTLFEKARDLGASGSVLEVANTGLLRVLFAQKKYDYWIKLDQGSNGHVLASAKSEIGYDRGHALFALKQWPDAVTAFDAFLREFPTAPAAPSAAYEQMLAAIQADPAQMITQADAYLKAYPQSPYRARVLLLEAQDYSRAKKYSDAAPIWEKLAAEPAAKDWPRREILLERARAYDELHQWSQAASAYRELLDDGGKLSAATQLSAEARMAVALQNDHQTLAAAEAWKAVQAQAPGGSPDQQVALESLGLIYAHGGPSQAALMAQTFRLLIERFPQTKLKALASFSVGDYLFTQRDYAGAEQYLLQARATDATTWDQPATQRLALIAYALKDRDKAVGYVKTYDQFREQADLPAALYYWLGDEAQKKGQSLEAETFFNCVIHHKEPGELLAPAYWQFGQAQSELKQWPDAVASYEQYEQLKPEAKNATSVLLALGRAQLGAQQLDAAKATANQALLQSPEGPNSAAARMLLAEVSFASKSYAEAARMFATLALLFDKGDTEPQAMSRAADAFEKAGDTKSAADWRAKLQAKYPQFKPASFL